MTVLQILFDVYKVVSVELHRRSSAIFMDCCPTCTNGYLMKEEYQSMIDSIRECVPLNGVHFQDDVLRYEKIPSCEKIKFIETQEGDRSVMESF